MNPTLPRCQISNRSKSYNVNCPHVALSKPNKELMVLRFNQLESIDPQKTGMCKALVDSHTDKTVFADLSRLGFLLTFDYCMPN